MDKEKDKEKEIERCVMFECFYNYEGICTCVDDVHNPYLNEDCIDYSED